MNLEKLKESIIRDAEDGVNFECACYYCGANPIDLVNRGDVIPIIYEMGELVCARCTQGGYYIIHDHVMDVSRKIELLRAFSGFDPSYRDPQIEKLLAIKEIQDFLEEYPIGLINVELLMKNSVSNIKKVLQEFKNDLIPKEGEI